jgi:hypothetical protein
MGADYDKIMCHNLFGNYVPDLAQPAQVLHPGCGIRKYRLFD